MKKVAFYGGGSDQSKCPFNGEVWTLNKEFRTAKRMDKLFFFDHDIFAVFPDITLREINNLNIPIVTYDYLAEGIKLVEIYPIKEIIKFIQAPFLVNTLALMFAYAAYLGYEEISLYGCSMGSGHEHYVFQRSGIEYMIGFCRGRGIKIVLSNREFLQKPIVYCYNPELSRSPYG